MWLTATFGAITHHAKSFATPRSIRLLDFFFLLKNSARNFFLTRNICSICFLGFAQPPPSKIKWSTPNWRIERRSVTSHSYGSKFSGSLQSLLTETVKVRLNDWRKVRATVLFLRAVIYVSFLVFSSAICALSQFVEMEKFCYHGKLTKRRLLCISALASRVNKGNCRRLLAGQRIQITLW